MNPDECGDCSYDYEEDCSYDGCRILHNIEEDEEERKTEDPRISSIYLLFSNWEQTSLVS